MKIGIDVGGTNLAAGLVDSQGTILLESSCKTDAEKGYASVRDKMADLVADLRRQMAEQKIHAPLEGVGIGVPGIVSRDGKTVVACPNLWWKNKPLKEDLEALIGLPVYLANDATVAGIAENRFGSTRGFSNAVMLTLGTGVGGCVIVNGQIVTGVHGIATEIGHMYVGHNFYDCNCGKNGCLETFSSATGLIRMAQRCIAEGTDTTILAAVGGDVAAIDAKMVMDAGFSGDAVGMLCVKRMIDHLAIAIASINDILDPEIYTIGGGVAQAGEALLTRLKASLEDKMTYPELGQPKVVLATLGNRAGIVGAACIDEYLKK